MKKALFSVLISISSIGIFAQTTTNWAGNFKIIDDATTPEVEGNLHATGYFRMGNVLSTQPFGLNSFASGSAAIASGEYSFAYGSNAIASAPNSFAFGHYAVAKGVGPSFAFNRYGYSEGGFNISFGNQIHSVGNYVFAVGNGLKVCGLMTTVFGDGNRVGRIAQTHADGTVLEGVSTAHSFVAGTGAHMAGHNSVVIGMGARGGYISPDYKIYNSVVSILALGEKAVVEKSFSAAIGYDVNVDTSWQMTLGFFNAPLNLNRYNYSWVDTDPVLVVGNGKSATERSNALIIKKNGDTTIYGNLNVDKKITAKRGGDIWMGEFGRPEDSGAN